MTQGGKIVVYPKTRFESKRKRPRSLTLTAGYGIMRASFLLSELLMPSDQSPTSPPKGLPTGCWVVAAIVGIVGLLMLAFNIYMNMVFDRMLADSFSKTRPFDAELWKSPEPVDELWTSRSEMVGDLLAQHDFVGWTRDEVEELLGPAEDPPTWEKRFGFVYRLGADRSFMPIDNEYLGFVVDDEGIVTEVYVWVD